MTTALDGIKVIDLSRVLAGPWASQLLADMGAEVIKVERPFKGDDTRHWGPPFLKSGESGESAKSTAAYFHCTNRNKKSIAIDITSLAGQKIIKDLVKMADVFIENHKVGALKKYGLDYQQLKQLNPRLVYCSITGFGQSGPYSHKPGYDAMIQAEGGLMSITGEPEGVPMKVGVALVDVMTGLYSSNAILAALMSRHKTNLGQYIDISLFDVQVATLANQGMNYLTTGDNPERLGCEHPNIVPYQTYETSDGYLILAIGNDQQFDRFCHLTELDELIKDKRYITNQQRVLNRALLIPIIGAKLKQQKTSYWMEQLEQTSVPCGAINTLKDVFAHPQTLHREMVKEVTDGNGKMIKTIASPINFSATPMDYKTASPSLGEHTQQILTERLNYDKKSIIQLYEDQTVS